MLRPAVDQGDPGLEVGLSFKSQLRVRSECQNLSRSAASMCKISKEEERLPAKDGRYGNPSTGTKSGAWKVTVKVSAATHRLHVNVVKLNVNGKSRGDVKLQPMQLRLANGGCSSRRSMSATFRSWVSIESFAILSTLESYILKECFDRVLSGACQRLYPG